MAFIEERIPVEISYGSQGFVEFNTDVVITKGQTETRTPYWSQALHSFVFSYEALRQDEGEYLEIKNWFMAAHGRAHAFRARDWGDFKSCEATEAVASTDQTLAAPDGVETDFQLRKTYSKGGQSLIRDIKKPVSGTTVIAIDSVTISNGWGVDVTTGIVVFDDITLSVTNATSSGANTIIDFSVAHGLIVGDSVYITTFTGDWSGLNAARFIVTNTAGTTITVAHDSSGYAAYSGNAGQIDTLPQTGEVITAGFEFDVPVRFDIDRLPATHTNYLVVGSDIPLKEVRL